MLVEDKEQGLNGVRAGEHELEEERDEAYRRGDSRGGGDGSWRRRSG